MEMSGCRDCGETPDQKRLLPRFVHTVSLLALIGAGFAPVLGFAAKTLFDSPAQSGLAPAPLSAPRLQANPAIDGQGAMPRIVAQASTDPQATVRERYDQMQARVDALLAGWEKSRSIVPGFDQSLDFILETRAKSVDAYFDADYAEAVRLLNQALARANQIFESEEKFYGLNMSVALQALEAESFARANEAIELAIALRPDSEDAKSLQQRIAQLPDLIAARQAAAAARTAGSLHKEINALEQVLGFAPDDASARARVDQLRRELRKRNFNQTIGRGYRAVAENDLQRATEALTDAQQMKPSDPQTMELQQAVSDLSKRLMIAQLIAAAEQSAEQDDWYAVQLNFEQALKLQPHANDANEGYELARRMVMTQRTLDDFLSRPQRLSATNIAEAAREEIMRAEPLLALSARMRGTAEELAREIQKWQAKMPVRVLSDGETHIEVRGFGVVGKVTERIVHLRPGEYLFEGKRKGFRNKLVEVQVSNDPLEITTITVLCDEPT